MGKITGGAILAILSCLGIAPALPAQEPVSADTPHHPPGRAAVTRVLDPAAARRLRANKGVTLQWIDWNRRGTATISVSRGGVWGLNARQAEARGPGRLAVEGRITEIGSDYFLLDGTVRITDTPDRGRTCEKHDVWRFAITQNRRYWRIRTFEWCDDLTDYIDIYF